MQSKLLGERLDSRCLVHGNGALGQILANANAEHVVDVTRITLIDSEA